MFQLTAEQLIFEKKYRLLRHVCYWAVYLVIWTSYWTLIGLTFSQNLYRMFLCVPMYALFSYPVAYLAIPQLLKKRYLLFVLAVVCWGMAGWYMNMIYRAYIFLPLLPPESIFPGEGPASPISFLCMTTTTGCMTICILAKRWVVKQKELVQAEGEKTVAQMQLLKAQLHPHFLFNTLNNIYSFALQYSPKTPQLILQLSSLLNYMLYHCQAEKVRLEKEVEVMKDYMDLERERYGNSIELSVNVQGDISGRWIAPLLLLPFLENGFKHGTSEQLDKPWMSVDISVKGSEMSCKVANSKNEFVPFHEDGVGIRNVRKRLEILYPDAHLLKLDDEGEFFVVSLLINLEARSIVGRGSDRPFAPVEKQKALV